MHLQCRELEWVGWKESSLLSSCDADQNFYELKAWCEKREISSSSHLLIFISSSINSSIHSLQSCNVFWSLLSWGVLYLATVNCRHLVFRLFFSFQLSPLTLFDVCLSLFYFEDGEKDLKLHCTLSHQMFLSPLISSMSVIGKYLKVNPKYFSLSYTPRIRWHLLFRCFLRFCLVCSSCFSLPLFDEWDLSPSFIWREVFLERIAV